jgi:hypothetical protein
MSLEIKELSSAIELSNQNKGSFIIRFTSGGVKGKYLGWSQFDAVTTRKAARTTSCITEGDWRDQLMHTPFHSESFEIICVKEPKTKADKSVYKIIDDSGTMHESACPDTATQALVSWFEDNDVYSMEESQAYINLLNSLDLDTLVEESLNLDTQIIFDICGFSLERTEITL